ncbi:hypothetical protein CRG98_012187 [Punica granatum]|uniref:Uncharacterized protein n=1 Tax=Punica granatum TaxID=22663 RepID=A0A2I0KFZ5_PUNGR|nr:hypothetical protein CRG98_012187 [Punica granatum]
MTNDTSGRVPGVCAPEFHLVRARMREAYAMRLGSVHLPVGTRDGHACSGIAVISVFCECVPKIHREAFATTETSLGEPCRVPKGRLKLVPRPRWSLGACRPVLGCRLLVSGAGLGSPVIKGVRERSEASRLKRYAPETGPDVSLLHARLEDVAKDYKKHPLFAPSDCSDDVPPWLLVPCLDIMGHCAGN